MIEGSNLAAVDSTGYSDPYVVFTCNGKTKTSSIKFQTLDPQWNGNHSNNLVPDFVIHNFTWLVAQHEQLQQVSFCCDIKLEAHM